MRDRLSLPNLYVLDNEHGDFYYPNRLTKKFEGPIKALDLRGLPVS